MCFTVKQEKDKLEKNLNEISLCYLPTYYLPTSTWECEIQSFERGQSQWHRWQSDHLPLPESWSSLVERDKQLDQPNNQTCIE